MFEMVLVLKLLASAGVLTDSSAPNLAFNLSTGSVTLVVTGFDSKEDCESSALLVPAMSPINGLNFEVESAKCRSTPAD